MDIGVLLNSINTIMILGVTIPAIFIARKIFVPKVRTMSILLAGFLLIHGVYHLIAAIGGVAPSSLVDFLGDGFVEPLSWLALVAFAIALDRLEK